MLIDKYSFLGKRIFNIQNTKDSGSYDYYRKEKPREI